MKCRLRLKRLQTSLLLAPRDRRRGQNGRWPIHHQIRCRLSKGACVAAGDLWKKGPHSAPPLCGPVLHLRPTVKSELCQLGPYWHPFGMESFGEKKHESKIVCFWVGLRFRPNLLRAKEYFGPRTCCVVCSLSVLCVVRPGTPMHTCLARAPDGRRWRLAETSTGGRVFARTLWRMARMRLLLARSCSNMTAQCAMVWMRAAAAPGPRCAVPGSTVPLMENSNGC
jgi:hypothetical protein